MTTWSEACETAGSLLEQQYRHPGVFDGRFWFGGNALHAYLTSRLALKKPDANGLLRYAHQDVYRPGLTDPNWWRDDYGWWGNAFCLAVSRRAELGYSSPDNDQLFADLLEQAVFCWGQLDAFWRDKPFSAENDNARDSAEITGGTFNTEPDGVEQYMSGRNCVTNSGFWLLSRELFRLTGDPRYRARADDEDRWFTAWLDRTAGSESPGLLTSKGLVRERPTGHTLVRDWHWIGDQGLFVKAYLWQQPGQPPFVGSRASKVAEALLSDMVDGQGVLHEDMSFNRMPPLMGYLADYATGKGIVLRNLSEVCDTYFGQFWTDQNALPFISVNARAVWRHRDRATGLLPFNWNPDVPGHEPHILTCPPFKEELCALIVQASGLDALSAAVRYLPDEEIEETVG